MYRRLLKNIDEWNTYYYHMKVMSYTVDTDSPTFDPLSFPCLLLWVEIESDYATKCAIQYDFVYPDEFE